MFVKQIRCVLATATTPVAQSPMSFLAGVVPLHVRVGRALAVAAVFAAPALVSPAHGAGFSISDPSGACGSWSWDAGTSTLTCVAAGAPAPVAPPVTLGNPSANSGNPTPTVPAAGGGGGGAGWGGTCPGYSNTIVMNFNYRTDGIQYIQTSNGMSRSEIMVATFTTPATIAGGTGANGTLGITDNAQNSEGFKGRCRLRRAR